MALEFTHGAFQWATSDALNTSKVVSGLGFAPKAIRFYWVGINSTTDVATQTVNERRGIGFASNSSGSVVQRAVGTTSVDGAATSDCGSIAVNNGCVVVVDAGGLMVGRLAVTSFDSDGFTMNVDDVTPATFTVFWEAWGGSDITNVTIGDIAEPAATGTQNYTATGFVTAFGITDQVVMLAGVQSTAAVNTGSATDSGLYVGFATSTATGQNIVVGGNSDDSSASMDTDGTGLSGLCVSMCTIGGGTTASAAAVLSGFGTDQFTLNWTARTTTNRRSIYMAIKGGSWRAGSYTIDGNTVSATATVSGLSFTPKGLSLMGRMTAATTGWSSDDRIGLGSGSSTTSRRAMGVLDEAGTGSSTAEIDMVIEYDQVLAFPSTTGTLHSAYDINAMNSDGFQIIVDVSGGSSASEWQGYLTFGDAAGGGSASPTIVKRQPDLLGGMGGELTGGFLH